MTSSTIEDRSETYPRLVAITGAGSGIGRSTALALAARSVTVGLLDRDQPAVNAVAQEITGSGGAAIPIECDVRDAVSVGDAFRLLADTETGPSGLVCSAGIELQAPMHQTSDESWHELISTNLTGAFYSCREALSHFVETPTTNQSIVCVSSPLAVRALPNATAYAASKAGLLALVRGIAVEYGGAGIRSNAVLPGATETPLMWSNVPLDQIEDTRDVLEGEIAIGRLASPEEIARVIVWLLSSSASYVTGAEVACDGGVLARVAISA